MTDPTARTLELLSLLRSGRVQPAGELAARLDTPPRTVRRDLDRLRRLGYPIDSVRGPGGGYRLAVAAAVPPLPLTDDALTATVVALRGAADTPGCGEAAEGALRKLETAVPHRIRHRARAFAGTTGAGRGTVPAVEPARLRLLAGAARERLDVHFRYPGRDGVVRRRRVEPYRQTLLGRHWYLLGWDRDRSGWRTFRIDRMTGPTVPGTTFAPREPSSAEPVSFVQDGARFRRCVVWFDAPVSTVSDRLTAEAGTLEAIDAHSCRYVAGVDSWEWLAVTLAATGLRYRVESPDALIEHCRRLATS